MVMRKKNNKEILKGCVSNIISRNNSVFKIISDYSQKYDKKFVLTINGDENSRSSKSNGQVILGTGNIRKLYDLCNDFCKDYPSNFYIDNTLAPIHNDYLCIEISNDLKEDSFDNIGFLNGEVLKPSGYLTICALAFTLYHEFGHIKCNNEYRPAIEYEKKADFFAMDVVKDNCSHYPKTDISCNPFFLGALLETSMILKICDPIYTEIDTSHPHPIERLYTMLEYFHIEDDSYLWQYVYDVVDKWINEHHLARLFEKEGSKTVKDKLLDAYLRFKK